MLETGTEVLVYLQQFLGNETLAVWRVHNHYSGFRVLLEILDVAALNLNAVAHHSRFNVSAGTSNHAAIHVVTINLMLEFALGRVILID